MVRSRLRVLAIIAALVLVAPFSIAAAQTPEPAQENPTPLLANAMPADTPLYLAAEFDPDNPQAVQLSALAAQLLVPGAGNTLTSVVKWLTGFLVSIPSDLATVLEGEIGIGLTDFGTLDLTSSMGGDGTSSVVQSLLPGYAVVLYPQKAGEARQLVENWYSEQLKQAGIEPERTQDGAVVILANPNPGSAYIPDVPAVVIFAGDYIVVGSSYEDALPFVDAIRGNIPTLAQSDDLEVLTSALPAQYLMFGYVDGEQLFDSFTSIFDSASVAGSIDAPFGQTAFTVAADEPGIRLESVSMPTSGPLTSNQDISENPDFATRVPDTTLAMVAGQNLGNSWAIQQLQKILLSVLAGTAGGADIDLTDIDIDAQFGVMAMLTGINFKTDLMDQLQGDYGAALISIDTANPLSSSAVVASELEDPDRVSVAVTSIGPLVQSAGAGTASVTTSSIDGQTVNNVTLSSPVDGTIQYGVVDDLLLVGIGDGIATVASTQTSYLADAGRYQDALAELPSAYDSVIYLNLEEIARAIAPLIISAIAENSNNALADCVAENTLLATPVPAPALENSTLGTICSIVGALLGPDVLQNFIVSRIPGPFAAVTYDADGLQHVSGILMVGSNN